MVVTVFALPFVVLRSDILLASGYQVAPLQTGKSGFMFIIPPAAAPPQLHVDQGCLRLP